jgi:DNA-directed RNA polymerase subunit RPC12/RpoP
MHCVLCSTLLHATNQVGIVCQECKGVLEGERRERGQAIRVRYCAGCGKPFHPVDDSIRHRVCCLGSASTNFTHQRLLVLALPIACFLPHSRLLP